MGLRSPSRPLGQVLCLWPDIKRTSVCNPCVVEASDCSFSSSLLYAISPILATHFQNFFWILFVKLVVSTSNLYWTTSSIAYLVKPFNGFDHSLPPIHRNFTYQLCKSVRNSSISMLMFCTIILPLTFCISASASLPLVCSAQ